MQPIELEEDGFITVRLGEVEKRLDLYEVHNRMVEMRRRLEGRPIVEVHQAMADLLKELGFPDCSHRTADRFALAVAHRAAELEQDVKNVPSGLPTPG